MRVFNLTDVTTPVLVSRGLVNAPVRVGGKVIPPGGSSEVSNLSGANAFISLGALAVNECPAEYLKKKAKVPVSLPQHPVNTVVVQPVVEVMDGVEPKRTRRRQFK